MLPEAPPEMVTGMGAETAADAYQAEQTFMRLVGQVGRQWRRTIDRRLRPLGLTEATWLPLLHLARASEPMRQKDLAASLAVDGSAVVRVLDGLEAAGLVVRVGHADRRAKNVQLTPQGERTVQDVKALLRDERHQLFATLPVATLQAAHGVLEHLVAQLALPDMQPDAHGDAHRDAPGNAQGDA